jgi:hypothetical protein
LYTGDVRIKKEVGTPGASFRVPLTGQAAEKIVIISAV